MTRPPVTSLLPPIQRAALADLLVKVRQLVAEQRTPLAWDTLRLVEKIEYAELRPPELGGMLRATTSHGLRDSDRHALETVAEAMKSRGIEAGWTPQSLARHIQAVLQGAFILAKASGDRAVALACIDHLEHYLTLLFSFSSPTGKLS